MRITLLRGEDADGDPVIGQLTEALESCGHRTEVVGVERDVPRLASRLAEASPDLVFNLAESFAGVSALESSVGSTSTRTGRPRKP